MTGSMTDESDFAGGSDSGGEKGSSGEEFSPNLSLALISQKESSVGAQPEGFFSQSLRETFAPTSSTSGFDGNNKGNESLRTRILSLFLFSQSVLLSISPWL